MIVISKPKEEQSQDIGKEIKKSGKWWAIVGIGIGVFIFALDVYIINLALPIMVESLHTSFATIQWVVLSYLLAIAIFVLSAAKLGDMWSKKQLYIMGLIVFTLSSLLCGIAPNVSFLIAFRALQGIGAAFISGLGTAMIVEVFPPEERGLALGIRAGIFGLGIMLGPTVGGILINLCGWPLIFLINVPIGIIACLIVAYLVPPSVVGAIKQSFDVIGTLILTLTLTSFTLAITLLQNEGFGSNTAFNLLVLSAISFTCFLLTEANLPEPMLDLNIFKSLDFSLGLGLRFLGNFVMAGVIFLLPFFLKLVKQYPTEQAGLLLAVPPIIIVLTAPIAGILSDNYGSRIISLIGLVLMAIGCLIISTFDTELTILNYIIEIIPYGLGVGMFQSPNNSAIMGAAPQERLGIASGLLSLSRILGQTAGVPLVGAVFSFVIITNAKLTSNIDITNAPIDSLVFATQITFRVVAALLLISTIFAVLLWWLEKKNWIFSYPNPRKSP
ncbi:MFS transporter [Anabaena cylindrica FACHB-243]|uniref:Drug resistance transporter, EmrB/QacA subfamily n=1 Tax=Anabaena cylindrica (strain ATCC 27899 / PCC 7122) TaxID=272123 RepID=K9ZFB7_ANACC|nr:MULTISPECIES: MFS transporter [Anabaena]AFZ57913.1 drug resistance transporter, EmrB/QacA subfamily [Anabaena cylindrica PCC 7122]MBD2419732.1 MFS transporter [Anabaena cylindrica FACHB-243]MBY5281565.1 MFS transporter [Anabaena sp. CCAP 1446/1C]MBY5307182.1 MFS transporter [Anabaena sp. CCAP 1446/1C]MCM2405545.1 MFS transporter [Anabaena sp. CCAP 1446/1C]